MKYTLESVPTPAIVINLPAVRRNIHRAAEYARLHKLKLRPHFKTHKSRFFAGLQLDAGACGITCAKIGEAEVLFEQGRDILLAYPALDAYRTERLAALARKLPVRVAVDSALAIERLGQAANASDTTLGILVDVDIGFHRTGVQTIDEALQLAQRAASTPGTRFDGILCYPGHIGPSTDALPALAKIEQFLADLIARLQQGGFPVPIVSGGSTPTQFLSHHMPSLTEIRPGTYIFNDRNTLAGEWCGLDDCAARIITTIVSNAVPGKLVVDAGSKTLTSDRLNKNPDTAGYGLVVELPKATLLRISEEHGEIDISSTLNAPALGSRLSIIPNHICPCINLQDRVWLQQEDGELEPLTVEARGCVV